MTGTTTQEAGQFAGNTPFLGHNIQGHSVSVKLVREVPAEVLRTSVTHFGTRGLFGKAIRRTSQHDHDNVRRKKWRIAQSLKPKVKPKPKDRGRHGASGDNAGVLPPNSNFPGPVNATARRHPPTPPPLPLPPPLPSPPPNIVDPSSLPTHVAQTHSQIRSASAYEESSCTATVPTSASDGTLPTFADYHSHILSPANHFGNAAASPHPSSHYAAPASEGDMYLDTGYCSPVLTLNKHSAIQAPFTIEPVNSRHGIDASMSEPPFIWQASSRAHITTWTDKTPKVPHDELAVDANVNIRIAEINCTQGGMLYEKPLYWAPSSPLGAARSERPISTSVGHEGGGNQVYHSILGGLHATGETHSTWYGYPASSAAHNPASYTASISPYSPIAPSPPHDMSPGRKCMPPVNRYSTPMRISPMHEREDWGISFPPNACGPSLAPTFNQYQYLRDDVSTRISTSPSDELVSDLMDRNNRGFITGYTNATSLPNELVGTCGLTGPSMNAPQDVWQDVPELYLAGGVDANIDINTHPSCLYSHSLASEAYYKQASDRSPSMDYPSWSSPVPRMDNFLASSEKARRDNGAPPSHFHASPCTPLTGVGSQYASMFRPYSRKRFTRDYSERM